MEQLDPPKTLSELLDPGMTLMVGTPSSTGVLDSRPLTVADVQGDMIRVLVDTTAEWADQARAGETAHVTVNDNRKNTWIALDARMALSTDDDEIDELWNPFAGAYFDDGRDSPNIGVLHIDVKVGTYWTAPSGRVGALISMLKAKVSGAGESGEHGAIAL